MPADIDLRAEVLKGLDGQIKYNETADLKYALEVRIGNQGLKALRHLREIAERHRSTYGQAELPDEAVDYCEECRNSWPCPTIRALAPDYASTRQSRAPVVEIDPADIARVYEPGTCAHPEGCPCTRGR